MTPILTELKTSFMTGNQHATQTLIYILKCYQVDCSKKKMPMVRGLPIKNVTFNVLEETM